VASIAGSAAIVIFLDVPVFLLSKLRSRRSTGIDADER
jgi:hypothetical protein